MSGSGRPLVLVMVSVHGDNVVVVSVVVVCVRVVCVKLVDGSGSVELGSGLSLSASIGPWGN